MEYIKQEKGVTIISLVITVIALIIIAIVSINMGTYDVEGSIDSKLEGELKIVQYAIFQQYVKYKTTFEEKYIIGEDYNEQMGEFVEQNYNTLEYINIDSEEKYKRYYKITPEELIRIGIQDSQYSYIVNYYTGEVFNADIFYTNEGKPLYIKGAISDITESF